MSKFKIGDIIRGTIIAMGAGTDRLGEVPCLGIVIPHDTEDAGSRTSMKTITSLFPKKNWHILACCNLGEI